MMSGTGNSTVHPKGRSAKFPCGLCASLKGAPDSPTANDVCKLRRKAQAIFRRRRHQPRRPPLATTRPGDGARDGSPLRCLKKEGAETTTASCQGEKATASQDQAGKASTDDGAGDGHGLAGERKARVERWRRVAAHDIGAHPQPV